MPQVDAQIRKHFEATKQDDVFKEALDKQEKLIYIKIDEIEEALGAYQLEQKRTDQR